MEDIIIVIPAYNPDSRLLKLVEELREREGALRIIIINDGSRQECGSIFKELQAKGCKLITHAINQGKGKGIKSGIKACMELYPNAMGLVTADADGQHRPDDILKIVAALRANPKALVLGVRCFKSKKIPLRSRVGNRFTARLFALSTGVKCRDTQTGLRGFSASFYKELLQIKGERFEYEMNFLTQLAKEKVQFVQIGIETVYIDENKTSNFNPVKDSLKVVWNLVKFSLSSLLSAGIDMVMFLLFSKLLFLGLPNEIFLATICARVISGTVNFTLNKNMVFKAGKAGRARQFLGYALLFVIQALLSAFLVTHLVKALSSWGFWDVAIKAVVDGILFFISFFVQKRFVFKKKS
ncbi:MAG: bifunctional glycosyltransferase family 2/GtrA family protein [Oscillospiraceae bacterium]|nr:bifunctional glycosyltransferase family 2/GtrA family protein [Oscillospiraceae bacterium]